MAPTTQLQERETSCPGGQCANDNSSEKIYLGAGLGVSGGIILAVGCIVLYKRLRTRQKAKTQSDSMATPMMSQFAPSTFSFHGTTLQPQNTYQPPSRPPISPLAESYHDGSSSGSSSSSSGHSHKSPMSDHSSQFAFPLLSADGHLMAPLPASSRNSWNIQEGDLGSAASLYTRPLPVAPGSPAFYDDGNDDYDYAQYQYVNEYEKSVDGHSIKSPIPYNPNQKWSYQPPSEEVVGLYPNVYEQGYEYERDGGSIKSQSRTPKIQDTYEFHQPQAATFHRSFSAEGENIRMD